MWLPGEEKILFDAKTDSEIGLDSNLYVLLTKYIKIETWKNSYQEKYYNWLNKDDNSIYNINDDININMVNALTKVNEILKDEMIFYWFDVDRTNIEYFNWKYCPISKKKIILLEKSYHYLNRLVSPVYPLIFPKIKK